MKHKFSLGYIALGLLCIVGGLGRYSSGWDFKYQQPTSKIGSIALICFGALILLFELAKFIKNSKRNNK